MDIKGLALTQLRLPKPIEHEFRLFCEAMLDRYWGRIKSMIVYGSVARREYFPERSDINLLIVLDDCSLESLRPALEALHRAREGCRLTPFFLSPQDIETSRDVFPIKFHDMKDSYVVIYGHDVIGDLKIDDVNLRLELEQELKILVLELRQFFIQRSRKNAPPGTEHFIAYFNSFLYLVKRLLKLLGTEPPMHNDELVDVAAKQLELDKTVLKRGLEYKKGKQPKNLIEDVVPFSRAVEKVANVVDRMMIAEKAH
jgi:predicted nucleotidyltransferase